MGLCFGKRLIAGSDGPHDFDNPVCRLRHTSSAPGQRPLVRLTYQAFLRPLGRDPGPWTGFATESAQDFVDLLIAAQPAVPRAQAQAAPPANSPLSGDCSWICLPATIPHGSLRSRRHGARQR